MTSKEIVEKWFDIWSAGDYKSLPISEGFSHTSPFGTIEGKRAYFDLVEANRDKFLGYQFKIHDAIYDEDKACVRYTAIQNGFGLDVSEWHYLKHGLIEKVVSYYHIGEVRGDRKLAGPEDRL